ncbi:hypothetical protein F7725_011392, partial [Dissostichus mawsoni]
RCYRVVSITADHQSGGSAGHFRSRRGSQLAQRLQPAPRLQSQAPLRPCPRQGRETPGQTTETLPAADCLMLTAERIQAKGSIASCPWKAHSAHSADKGLRGGNREEIVQKV